MYESYYFGVTGPGFLTQVPTLPITQALMLQSLGCKTADLPLRPMLQFEGSLWLPGSSATADGQNPALPIIRNIP